MGMPVTLEVVDQAATPEVLDRLFCYFEYVDGKFSTYKENSEISQINRGEISLLDASPDMKEVFDLAEEMKHYTNGYFDIWQGDHYDPSGLVKGWTIFNAAEMLREEGFQNYYVEAGGDFQAAGKNSQGEPWHVGIQNPFHPLEIVKVLSVTDCGMATSGTYVRGQHIYNPKDHNTPLIEIVSLTVLGPEIYTADCYATAAFAMGREGIQFIEEQDGYEGYMIDTDGIATYTSGFTRYVL
jgi:thiamine biosynthesis lipoprotein